MAARGPGVWNVIIALSLVYMPRTALLTRSTVLSLRELDYVQAALALGRSDLAVAFRHVLPNCLAPLLVQGTFIFAYAVLAEAILGFLGVGVPPYVPSWGNVIASGKNVIREAFWVSLFPDIALTWAGFRSISSATPCGTRSTRACGCSDGRAWPATQRNVRSTNRTRPTSKIAMDEPQTRRGSWPVCLRTIMRGGSTATTSP